MDDSSSLGPQLTFRILGRFEVVRGDAPLRDADLGSRKERRLLKLLVLERGHVVSNDRIVDALWSDPPPRAARLVATLVSRLRATLGRSVIASVPDGYQFVLPPGATVDLDLVSALVAEADRRLKSGDYSLARTAADRALTLLERGTVLEEEPYDDWIEAARAGASSLQRRALVDVWSAALAARDAAAAIHAAERLVAADRFDEEAHRALMLAEEAAGRRGEALATYERLRDALSLELGVEPAPETSELQATIAASQATGRDAWVDDGATASDQTRPDALDPGFVGREAEMAFLTARWRSATEGHTTLLLLTGEAGIGKTTIGTRLVTLVRATGGLVLESRCYESERSLFLQPVADAIRPLIQRLNPTALRTLIPDGGSDLARVLPDLPAIAGVPLPEPTIPELERRRAFEGAAGLIAGLAGRQPVLLYLDDLHVAGAATLEFLHFLVRRAAPSRLLVLGTVRVEEGDEARRVLGDVAETLEVAPLPSSAVRRLASTMGADAIGERLSELTRGHPLFVVEMLRALAERSDGTPSDAAVPETLRAAILERVQRAGRDVVDLLGAAAVLGARFDLELVARLLGASPEDVVRVAERAHRARLLVPADNEFAFSNDLIHETVYAAVAPPVRTYRHHRAASLLAGRPELVARHRYAAGEWAEAARSWLEAADEASRHYANRDAEALLDRALDAARRGEARALEGRIRLARGRVLETLGKYPQAVEDAAAAVEIARATHDRQLEMEGLRDMGGDPIVALGRTPADCIPNLEASRAIARELGDLAFEIDILRRLAVISTNDLDGGAARRYGDSALESARAAGDELALAAALDARKTVAAYIGEVDVLEATIGELRPILERRELPWFLQWTVFESSFVPMARGDWATASRRIAEALELNDRTGYRAYQAMFLAQRASIESSAGRLGDALDSVDAALAIAEDVHHPWWLAFAASVRGHALIQVGALERATRSLEAGFEIADRDGTRMYVLRCAGPLAEALALAGDASRARTIAERATALLPPAAARPLFLHPAQGAVSTARAWTALGEPRRALPILAEVAAAAEASGWVEPLAASHLALGMAQLADEHGVEAADALHRAVELAGEPLPAIAADALAQLSRIERGDGHEGRAMAFEAAARSRYASLIASLGPREERAGYEALVAARLGESLGGIAVR